MEDTGYVDRVAFERIMRLHAASAQGAGQRHAALLRRVTDALDRVLDRSGAPRAPPAHSPGGGGRGGARRDGAGAGSWTRLQQQQQQQRAPPTCHRRGHGHGHGGGHGHGHRGGDWAPPCASAPTSARPERLLRLCRPAGAPASGADALCARLLGVLNKLAGSNYDALRDKAVAMFRGAIDGGAIDGGVDLVLDKAAQDRSFGALYARLLADVAQAVAAARAALEARMATACQSLSADVEAAARLLEETDQHSAEVADQTSALYDVFCRATRDRARLLNRHRMLVRLTFPAHPTVPHPAPCAHAAWLADGVRGALDRGDEHALHMWVEMADAALTEGGGRLSPSAEAGLRALLREVCKRGPQRVRFRAMDVLGIRPSPTVAVAAAATRRRGPASPPRPAAVNAAAAATGPARHGGGHRHHRHHVAAAAVPGRAPW